MNSNSVVASYCKEGQSLKLSVATLSLSLRSLMYVLLFMLLATSYFCMSEMGQGGGNGILLPLGKECPGKQNQ